MKAASYDPYLRFLWGTSNFYGNKAGTPHLDVVGSKKHRTFTQVTTVHVLY